MIDDGSTDDTAAIAESYAPRVRVFRRSNQYQSAARNFGVQESTSEWIAFLDDDDTWEPNKLERQMEELTRHPEADLCYTGRVLIMQKGDTATIGRTIYAPPAKDIRKSLFEGVTFFPSSALVRRTTLLAMNGFDPKLRICEDYDLWLRMLHAGTKFAACREPLLRYRLHEANTSKNMVWFESCMGVYRQLVQPYLPRFTGWITYFKYLSDHEADVAYALRKQGDPAHLAMMARSVLHWPSSDLYRYKSLILMLYLRVRKSVQHALKDSAR